ncbi:MarR family transcriptional regulator [Halorubrum virus BJ1]|uniref:Uncharacterized protein n=1 Tax=Halorubrum virus BJ1 TaxID=416419 RepID=A0ZYQ2_9CAUD|nr:MarR family transcriptional regulator [Halorubrum virus BJ1]CAL92461.1 hypothetical protein [Halorubrum virus BJ1]
MSETVDVADLSQTTRERLRDLPPTATVVYVHLRNEGSPRTLRQIAYETVRPERSVRRALRQLHDEDLVSCSPRHTDPPQSEWEAHG